MNKYEGPIFLSKFVKYWESLEYPEVFNVVVLLSIPRFTFCYCFKVVKMSFWAPIFVGATKFYVSLLAQFIPTIWENLVELHLLISVQSLAMKQTLKRVCKDAGPIFGAK